MLAHYLKAKKLHAYHQAWTVDAVKSMGIRAMVA